MQADDATFDVFAKKVQADLDTIFRDYEIEDKSTMRALLNAKLDLQVLAGQYQAALETVNALRAMQEKPAAKLTTGLFYRAALQSAIDTKSVTGPTFEQTVTKQYSESINPLPWDVVQDTIRSSYAGSRVYTKSVAHGSVKTDLDPAVQKSGALDSVQAWSLISRRVDLQLLIPLNQVRADVLR